MDKSTKQVNKPAQVNKQVNKPAKRAHRLDWDAIERDHRTGKYTRRELADKYRTNAPTVQRRMTADRLVDPTRWQEDLRGLVREATAAKLITEMVAATVRAGHGAVNGVVNAAADLNAGVIMCHRTELHRARRLAMSLLDEVEAGAQLYSQSERLAEVMAGKDATPGELNEARKAVQRALGTGARVSSAKSLAETLTKLHAGERIAFSLDEPDESKEGTLAERLRALSDAPAPEHAEAPDEIG